MAFKDLLIKGLEGKLPSEKMELLPNGYQKVGHLIIVNFREGLEEYWSLIGSAILEIVAGARSVCAKTDVISGELRRPSLKVIAGSSELVVEHYENGVWFVYDASKIMFAKGNVSERGRLAGLVQDGEVIVDMFVGIGYFSVPIARKVPSCKIYGIDKNSDSVYWLGRTIEKNGLKNISVMGGDSKEEVLKLVSSGVKADRVLMGYLPPPAEFVSTALSVLKSGGMVHYDALISTSRREDDIGACLNLFRSEGVEVELVNAQRVKSYGPKVDHYVLDIRVL